MGNLKALLALTGATGALVSGAIVAFLSVGSVIAYEAGMIEVQNRAVSIGGDRNADKVTRTVAVNSDGTDAKDVIGGVIVSTATGASVANDRKPASSTPVSEVDAGDNGKVEVVVQFDEPAGPRPGVGGAIYTPPVSPPAKDDKPGKKDEPTAPPISSGGGAPPLDFPGGAPGGGDDSGGTPGDGGSGDSGDLTAEEYAALADQHAAKAAEYTDMANSYQAKADEYFTAGNPGRAERYAKKAQEYRELAAENADLAAHFRALAEGKASGGSAPATQESGSAPAQDGGSGFGAPAGNGQAQNPAGEQPQMLIGRQAEPDSEQAPAEQSWGELGKAQEDSAGTLVPDCSDTLENGEGAWGQVWLLYDPCESTEEVEPKGKDRKKDKREDGKPAGSKKSKSPRECVIEWELVTPEGEEPFWKAIDSCDQVKDEIPADVPEDDGTIYESGSQVESVSPDPAQPISSGGSTPSAPRGPQGGGSSGQAPITIGGGAPGAP